MTFQIIIPYVIFCLQANAEILSGLGAGLSSSNSSADVAATTMNIEAVMENLQRVQHQQRLREQKKNEEALESEVRCSGDDYSDGAERQRSFSSNSPKGDESLDDDRNDDASPGMIKDDDDLGRTSPESEKSLMAQQVALAAAALAQRSNPQNGGSIPTALSALMPHTMLQQFGQFPGNFDPSQLPQVKLTPYT